jgi:hypothetical protein
MYISFRFQFKRSWANHVLYEVDGENKLLQISEPKENLSI